MKEKLKKLLNSKMQQRDALNQSLIDSDSKEERAAIGETLKKLQQEITDIEDMLKDVDEPAGEGQDGNNGGEAGRSDEGQPGADGRGMNPMAAMQMRNGAQSPQQDSDPLDSTEYRTAFMNFVCRGVKIPSELIAKIKEKRSDAWTTTSDASAVIPTTIVNEIVQQLKSYGEIWARVRKLNVQGGVNIPILSLKPTATWITADKSDGTAESEKKKIQANSSVSFSYFGLECKVAQTLLTNVTTLQMFQDLFVPLATEAVVKALEIAIVAGTGSTYSQPVGIINDTRVDSSRKVTISTTDVKKWDEWKKQVFAKIPKAYRNGVFIMAQATFDGYIDGMVDSNGQPIGRVNYGIDGEEKYRFGGKEVLTVEEDILKSWDNATGHASTGDVIAIFVNLSDYAINSNLEMQTVKWVDNDTNNIYNKVIMICDGKLVDPNGVVIVKKGV